MTPQASRPYPKGVAMRRHIIETTLTEYAASGAGGPTFKAIADSVGLSQRGLTHYFPNREELLIATVQERDRVNLEWLERREEVTLRDLVNLVTARNLATPGLDKLFLDLAVAASDPAHPGHDFFVERYRGLRVVIAEMLTKEGVAESAAPARAALLVAAADGLHIQWLLDPAFDVESAAHLIPELIGLDLRRPTSEGMDR